ncbi:GNAT family [Phlyctema vagabunda]|uniref:GNAT family n=1 Tax=Phlyctema vagabunda TaxID=108571 RepID=A0ABR4P4B5_9HELO
MRSQPTRAGGPGHRYPPPSILPVKKQDVHAIAVFNFEASATSPLQSYLYPTSSDRASAIQGLEDILLVALSDPAYTVLKAVDPETGEAASYAVWQHFTHSESHSPRGGETGLDLDSLMLGNYGRGGEKNVREFVRAEKAHFMNSWAAEMNFVELQAIATSTRFQRRGYASALLNWGHQKADELGQVSFLLGSPVGRYLYASKGWKEVAHIVVDMKDWVEGGQRGDLGWGVWKLYHMIRLPKVAA